jgi:hypothetical protein
MTTIVALRSCVMQSCKCLAVLIDSTVQPGLAEALCMLQGTLFKQA